MENQDEDKLEALKQLAQFAKQHPLALFMT